MTRKFTIRLLVFAALLIAVNYTLDKVFKAFSVHNTLNTLMDKQFAEFDSTFTYLAMGNSHNCINTHILENSFNYGSPSESIIQSYYKLKYILEKSGKKPEYLLLQGDISSFGPKIADRYEYNFYWKKYIDYIELARIKNDRDILLKWTEGKFFSYVGNYKDIQLSILYRIKMKNIEMYRGYRPHRDFRNFADEPDRRKVAWGKANLFLSKDEYFSPVIKVYFEKILQLCQDHGVRVFMLRIPESKDFYEEELKIVPADNLYREVEGIANRYPVFQGTLDYHDLFFDHTEYFFDPDHLNIKGSDLFTTRLALDLKEIGSGAPAE
jgi:hypothetical protein